MQSDLLQKFLDNKLLDLGEDRDKFGFIQSAADDLAKTLLKQREKLAAAASIVLGGDLPDDDLVLGLCREAIVKHWPTYGSRFPIKPVQLFRATLLQALATLSGAEADVANVGIIYYTTCGLLPHFAAAHGYEIFRDYLNELAQAVEDKAAESWSGQGSSELQAIQFTGNPPSAPALDPKVLKEQLKNAIGPAGGTGANPQWPSSNTAEWMEHYAAASASAIGTAITTAINGVVPKVIAQSRGDSETAVKAYLGRRGGADLYRAELLYWKEALYSPLKKESYRQLSTDGAVYWMARDLHMRVPHFHPVSVEYFLRETVRSCVGDKEAKKKISLDQFIASAAGDIKPNDIWPPSLDEDRLTTLHAVEAVVSKGLDVATAAARVGIPLQPVFQRDEFAVLVFRDLQARRLSGGK